MTMEQKKKVLLIEDEEILSNILSDKLARAGYDVEIARDGEAGFSKITSYQPDLILLDMMLPKLSGFGVLEKMQQEKLLPTMPVIVISNSGQPVEIERAEKMGIRDYLVKLNFDPDEVLEKVKNLLPAKEEASASVPATPQGSGTAPEPGVAKQEAGSQRAILVVEDDMFIADLLGRKLHEKFAVHQATDTRSSDQILKNNKIDLICLDIMLPGEDGFTYLGRLKQDPQYKNIPVVILSNLGQQEEIQKGIKAGAADYLVKANMAPHEIMERVEEILEE